MIGISNYSNSSKYGKEFTNLHGAVADADAIHNYLLGNGVPSDNIWNFRSPDEGSIPPTEQATWVNIMKALSDLKTCNIKKNEPILIYFAGHGGQTTAPEGWPSEEGKIQYLLPQDACTSDQGEIINIIPDYVIADRLAELATTKGNNIVCPGTTLLEQTWMLTCSCTLDCYP